MSAVLQRTHGQSNAPGNANFVVKAPDSEMTLLVMIEFDCSYL